MTSNDDTTNDQELRKPDTVEKESSATRKDAAMRKADVANGEGPED